jgi:hypothetical protein
MKLLQRYLLGSFHKAAHWVFDRGRSSFSFAGTSFLNAMDAKRIFSNSLIYEGQDSCISIPSLTVNLNVFFENSANDSLQNNFIQQRSINIQKPFTLKLKRHGRDRFFESEGTLLILGCDQKLLLAPEFSAPVNLRTPFKPFSKNSTSHISIFSSLRSFTYGDFGLLMLPKWCRLKTHCEQLKTTRAAVCTPDVPFMREWAKHLNLETLSFGSNTKKLNEIKDEVTVLYGPGLQEDFICTPSDLSLLRKSVLPFLGTKDPQKIYISRNARRKPSNQADIERCLSSKGFVIIQDHPRGILDQAEIFSTASFIVAPHGASLANLAFSKPGTKVLEFLPGKFCSPVYRQLSALNSLNYACLICGKLEKHKDSAVDYDYEVDIQLLNQALSILLK